jgi:Tfp pilus assembly protein FimV
MNNTFSIRAGSPKVRLLSLAAMTMTLLLGVNTASHAATLAIPAAPLAAPRPATGPAPAAPVTRSYKVVRGDTLDKVIHKTLEDSPLRIELLRNAFVQLNPQVFAAGPTARLRPDQVLQVPDAMQLLRAVAVPLLESADNAAPIRAAAPTSAEELRRWVRFP